MKTALYIVEDKTQIVLTPENDHEKAILKLAEEKSILGIYRGSFYECRGGWIREGMDDDSVILLLAKIPSKENIP